MLDSLLLQGLVRRHKVQLPPLVWSYPLKATSAARYLWVEVSMHDSMIDKHVRYVCFGGAGQIAGCGTQASRPNIYCLGSSCLPRMRSYTPFIFGTLQAVCQNKIRRMRAPEKHSAQLPHTAFRVWVRSIASVELVGSRLYNNIYVTLSSRLAEQ